MDPMTCQTRGQSCDLQSSNWHSARLVRSMLASIALLFVGPNWIEAQAPDWTQYPIAMPAPPTSGADAASTFPARANDLI